MKASDFHWEESGLTEQDLRLIDAYTKVGRSVDDLAYTADFDRLVEFAGFNHQDDAEKHTAFRRLLNLRKRGRLPRLVHQSVDK